MTSASVYQQLRSHLAYLRLHAAAETLPAQLEQAGQQDLSHTAFLERLLATLTKNTVRLPGSEVTFDKLTLPTPIQAEALRLLGLSASL